LPFEVEATQNSEDAASTPRPLQPAPHPELAWLSPRHIGAAVRAHHGAFTACQTLADNSSRHREGVVTLGWLVKTDGSVTDVTVGPSSFESDRVNHCVLSVAKRVTFPPSSVQARVSWTVKFQGASNASLANAGLPSARSR
jgi:TonB family protein